MDAQAKKDFEQRFGNQDNVIRVVFDMRSLKGLGVEYFVQKGKIIHRFKDGKLVVLGKV